MQYIRLEDLLAYIEAKKKELHLDTDCDAYKNRGPRTPEKIELLKRIEQRRLNKLED